MTNGNGNGSGSNPRRRGWSLMDLFLFLGRTLWVRREEGDDVFYDSEDLKVEDLTNPEDSENGNQNRN